MLKYFYLLLISSFLGYMTFQFSQPEKPLPKEKATVELVSVDSALLSTEDLPIQADFKHESEEEIYSESGDTSSIFLYAILQFISSLYE